MGRRRLDRLEAMFSASASARTLAEADCPVLVVHEADPVPQAQVVAAVDVDGYAQEVLAYAFAEAARRGVPLRAVHVFNKPWVFETEGDVVDTDAVLAADQADLETRLQVLIRLGEADHPDVGVYPDVLKGGSPETVLIEASQTADLLVLGARRAADMRGGLEVGPVVRALLQDAACPVEVVPVA
jgi:nucleotide-binding universal stress UspA family protein